MGPTSFNAHRAGRCWWQLWECSLNLLRPTSDSSTDQMITATFLSLLTVKWNVILCRNSCHLYQHHHWDLNVKSSEKRNIWLLFSAVCEHTLDLIECSQIWRENLYNSVKQWRQSFTVRSMMSWLTFSGRTNNDCTELHCGSFSLHVYWLEQHRRHFSDFIFSDWDDVKTNSWYVLTDFHLTAPLLLQQWGMSMSMFTHAAGFDAWT